MISRYFKKCQNGGGWKFNPEAVTSTILLYENGLMVLSPVERMFVGWYAQELRKGMRNEELSTHPPLHASPENDCVVNALGNLIRYRQQFSISGF
jgi:hypothetical protein